MRILARLAALLALLALTAAATDLFPLADISGASSTTYIAQNSQLCVQYIQIVAGSSNASAVRFGTGSITSSFGLAIAAGAGYNTPVVTGQCYPLASYKIYVASGDKAYVAYGN